MPLVAQHTTPRVILVCIVLLRCLLFRCRTFPIPAHCTYFPNHTHTLPFVTPSCLYLLEWNRQTHMGIQAFRHSASSPPSPSLLSFSSTSLLFLLSPLSLSLLSPLTSIGLFALWASGRQWRRGFGVRWVGWSAGVQAGRAECRLSSFLPLSSSLSCSCLLPVLPLCAPFYL